MTWVVATHGQPCQQSSAPVGHVLNTINDKVAGLHSDSMAQSLSTRVTNRFWALELSKAALEENPAALAQAFEVQKFLARNESCAVQSNTPDVTSALIDASQGHAQLGMRENALLFVACAAAICAWIVSLILYAPLRTKRNTLPANTCFAVHGEFSTRTRHILEHLSEPQALIVLGRPKRRARKLHSVLNPMGTLTDHRLLFPFSWQAAAGSFRSALSLLSAGRRALTDAGFVPSFKRMVAIAYRMILGTCHDRWWQHAGPHPSKLVLGHTGLADTSRLETAAQNTGTKTVHLVHGISLGWNFTGLSDIAIWQCGHDVAWHTQLGGYGENSCQTTTRPPLLPSREIWQIYSNYAHPTHSAYQAEGLAAELRLISLVQETVETNTKVTWNLHPAHANLPPEVLKTLHHALDKADFTVNTAPLAQDALRTTAIVLTTPSTIAIEALNMGKLPIVITSYPICLNTAAAALPLQASTPQELGLCLSQIADEANQAKLFEHAFDTIAPSRSRRTIMNSLV